MSQLEYRPFYRRHLPHVQPPGAALFVTFRLTDSIPQVELEKLSEKARRVEATLDRIADPQQREKDAYIAQRRLLGAWDRALDAAQSGRPWLRDERVASLVSESLHHRHGDAYDLDACCVMPNHVHLVCKPLADADGTYQATSAIMHSLKLYTARRADRVLGREGHFWQHENYDHVVRDEEEYRRIIGYVLNNPVRARLVQRAEDWKWSYCKYQ